MSESKQGRAKRLKKDDRGRVLLSLLDEFGSISGLARKASVSPQVVAHWVARGYVSVVGAMALAKTTGREKEEFRPDLSDAEWEQSPRGRRYGGLIESPKGDAKVLADLAEKYGGVSAFCERAGITIGNFHTWKSRGRIPAIKIPSIWELRK